MNADHDTTTDGHIRAIGHELGRPTANVDEVRYHATKACQKASRGKAARTQPEALESKYGRAYT